MKHKPTKHISEESGVFTRQNFGLSEVEFEKMLQEMQQGDERLFENIFLAQFEETIAYLINRYQTDRASAYDATMDALLKFRKRLLEGKVVYKNMRFLFTQMASQFLTTTFKKQRTTLEVMQEEEVVRIDDAILDYLDVAWKQLGEQCSTLLENFYYKKISLKTLAETLGKSDVALRKQKQRCLETLRNYFLKQYKR